MNFDRKLAIWSFAIGLFGTAFGIWSYADNRQFAQITYSISNETIYRPSIALNTTLSLPDVAAPITSRVTQTVITIWNGGNVPFKGDDARSKLTISGDSSVSVLAYKVVLTKTLPGSSGVSVSKKDRYLEIDWRIFDPGEGTQLVLLSSGNSESIDVAGRFLPGQEIVRYPVKSILKSIAFFSVWIGSAIILMFCVLRMQQNRNDSKKPSPLASKFGIVIIAIVMASSLYLSYRVLYSVRSYVGDISPIDPDLTYIDINRKLDYRYVPM